MVQNQHVVVLIDRGLLDGSAYVSKTAWQALLDELGTSTIMLRENRYDAVLHMVTAADGAESFYGALSNVARYESTAEAIDKDKKLREAYMGHQRWFMIDNNCATFDAKIAMCKDRVHFILGKSGAGSSFYKKFLLKKSTEKSKSTTTVPIELGSNQPFEESQVIETFIKYNTSEGKVIESSVEKRGSNLTFTYTHKMTLEKHGQRYQKKKAISAADYIDLEQTKLPDMKTLINTRIVTFDHDLYIIIDYYPEVDGQPMICIIQINEEEHKRSGAGRVKLPSYIKVDRDITDLEEFQPKTMASISYKAADYKA